MNDEQRVHGSVRTLQIDRGFLFVEADGPGRLRYFGHITAFRQPDDFGGLQIGSRLTFVVKDTPRGLRADAIEVEA